MKTPGGGGKGPGMPKSQASYKAPRKPEQKPIPRSSERPVRKPEYRPEPKPEQKPVSRPQEQPVRKAEYTPEPKPERKPEQKPPRKPEDKYRFQKQRKPPRSQGEPGGDPGTGRRISFMERLRNMQQSSGRAPEAPDAGAESTRGSGGRRRSCCLGCAVYALALPLVTAVLSMLFL